MRHFLLVALLLCPLLAHAALPRPDHIVIVIEENRPFSKIIGNGDVPYINELAQKGALFTQSYALAYPSQPNYIALFSGSTQGVIDNSCPLSFTAPNLGGNLIKASLSFAGYSEDLPEAGSQVCNSGSYVRKHNPWVSFTDIPAASNLPFSSFPTDFSQLPTVAFVIPNQLNDMHDGTEAQADAWLKTNLDAYVQWAQTHNSLLILTWDEDDRTENNRIVTVFIGPMVVPGRYATPINHYSVLRTIEDMYGLPHAGNAEAEPIVDVWNTPAPQPGLADSDTDGFPDELEAALGTRFTDAASTPFGGAPAGEIQPVDRPRLRITLNFKSAAHDRVYVKGRLPVAAGTVVSNQPVTINVGGIVKTFTLDQRGNAGRGTPDRISMRILRRSGSIAMQSAVFTARFRAGSFARLLADEQLSNAKLKSVERSVAVVILFNDRLFQLAVPLRYSARFNYYGKARL